MTFANPAMLHFRRTWARSCTTLLFFPSNLEPHKKMRSTQEGIRWQSLLAKDHDPLVAGMLEAFCQGQRGGDIRIAGDGCAGGSAFEMATAPVASQKRDFVPMEHDR